jgi:RNA polymerase sigma-70 factor (ECF subfamily)
MDTTSASLLERLRRPADDGAWRRFVDLYSPLLFYWARRIGLQEPDAADLVQDVFALLLRKLPEFAYDRHGKFRAWLRTVTLNKWREKQRRRQLPVETDAAALLEVTIPAEAEAFWEADYQRHLVARALELMRAEFRPPTWNACWQLVVDNAAAARGRGVANPVELRHQREVLILNQHAQRFGTEQTELVYNAREAQPAEDWTPSLEDVLARDVRRRLIRNGAQSSKITRRDAATGQRLDASFSPATLAPNPESMITSPPPVDEKTENDDDADWGDDMAENDNIFRRVGDASGLFDDSGFAAGSPSAQGVTGGDSGWQRGLYVGGPGGGATATRNSGVVDHGVSDMDPVLNYDGICSPAIKSGAWRR